MSRPSEPRAFSAAAGHRNPTSAGAWNLGLNLFGKAESLALLIGGSIVGGLAGVGLVSTAMASSFLGVALADFGLTSEIGRLSVTHPTRRTVEASCRALILQAPLALFLAPAAFYVTLGQRVGGTAPMLCAIGLLAACLMGNGGLTAVFNGLGDFRTPALWLGGARLLASVGAVVGAALNPSPLMIIGTFLLAESSGLIALVRSIRRRSVSLPGGDSRQSRVRRTHLWLGAASVANGLTNQSDIVLVASILTPKYLGMFSIASLLQNGVGTSALSASTPFSRRAVRATVVGRPSARLLRQAMAVGVLVTVCLAVVTWGGSQVAATHSASLAPLTAGTGQLVLALCLIAAVPASLAGVCFAMGIGLGLHRAVGLAAMAAGLVAVVCITVGAELLGVVGAAAGTLIRDGFLSFFAAIALFRSGGASLWNDTRFQTLVRAMFMSRQEDPAPLDR